MLRRFSGRLLLHCASLSIIDKPLVCKQCAQSRRNQKRFFLSLSVSVHSGGQQWTAVREVKWVGVWDGVGLASLQSGPGSEQRGSRHLANNLGLVRN